MTQEKSSVFKVNLIKDLRVEDTSATSLEVDIWLKGATGTGPGAIRTLEITKTGQISVKEIP